MAFHFEFVKSNVEYQWASIARQVLGGVEKIHTFYFFRRLPLHTYVVVERIYLQVYFEYA